MSGDPSSGDLHRDLHELSATMREISVRLKAVEHAAETQTTLLSNMTEKVGKIQTQLTMIKGGGAGILAGGGLVGYLIANWNAFRQLFKP